MIKKVLSNLINKSELNSYNHDGCYELMQAVINSYKTSNINVLDYNDLNLIYLITVGTWSHGWEAKHRLIVNSNLSDAEKDKLSKLLNDIKVKAEAGKYDNEIDRGPSMGLFGTGFNSFKGKTDNESVQAFIRMCIDINEMTSDEDIFNRAGAVLNTGFRGMRSAVASMILHVLKPTTFSVINGNRGLKSFLEALEIKLRNPEKVETYIENCRVLKAFRDTNLSFKNYRVLDWAAWEYGGEKMFADIIKSYKQDFSNRDMEERYKWKAVKCFKDNWKIDAPDFREMLKKSLEKSANLLDTGYAYPRGAMLFYAEKAPDEVRDMFRILYDESLDLVERIDDFISSSNKLLQTHNQNKNKNHYQNAHVVSTYLFFRFPEKYYIYQYNKFKEFVKKTGYDTVVKSGKNENVAAYCEMCDLVLDEVKKDRQLLSMSKKRLDEECYQDPEYHLLADDVVYFGFKIWGNGVKPMPEKLNKNMIFYGPPGTGKTYHTVNYAVAIIEEKPVGEIQKEDYSVVLDRYNKHKREGLIEFTTFHQSFGYEEFIEGIRPVMNNAEEEDEKIDYKIVDGVFKDFCQKAAMPVIIENHDFGFSKSPKVWKVSLAGTGDNPVRRDCFKNGYIRVGWDDYGETVTDETEYTHGGKVVLNAFLNKMQKGDIVVSCYSERTTDAIGVVTGDYEWRPELGDYMRVRNVNWIATKSSDDEFLYDVYEMNQSKLMSLSTVYELKITVADILAILSEVGAGTVISKEPPKNHVFIIDEINRGNISKVFGELITLIEPSKRLGQPEAMKAKLPYSQDAFGVPENVYIIGTMNTADRSIALLDTALRRRFAFIEMMPDTSVISELEVEGVSIPDMLEKINKRVEVLHDREHTIGHAYFMDLEDDSSINKLAEIFSNKVIPLLQEYSFEDYEKIRMVLGDTKKTDRETQFVIEEDYSDMFDDAEDIVETKVYKINKNALLNIESYRNI